MSIQNIPARAGERAGPAKTLGEFGRYRVYPVHTRFEAIEWFVTDGERTDEYGLATVIRQEPTYEAAVSGLA